MAPVTLPYLHIYTRRGKPFAYVRRAGKRVRVHGVPGSPAFLANYAAALAALDGPKQPKTPETIPSSLQALWQTYIADPAYTQLAAETRKDYARLMAPILVKHGHRAVAGMTREWLLSARAQLADTPSRANRLVAVVRLLINFGQPRKFRPREGNPALGIKPLRTGTGHRAWTLEEFELMASPAAGAIALPVLMARFLVQREQDIIPMVWPAYDGQAITVTQRKSRHHAEPVTLRLPVHPRLKAALDARQETRDPAVLTICTRPDGKPWQLSHFKHEFTRTRRKLGLPEDLHFHGLRATGATALAEAGATPQEIQAWTGHKTLAMVTKYTRSAERDGMAKASVTKLAARRRKTSG